MLSRWWCWCLQLLLITKHLSLLPNRMSPTPLHIICVGGGGDKYHNKIFSSNQNNCECAQVPALTGLRKDARFSDAKTTLQLSMSVRHHHFLQNFQSQKRLYICQCPSVIITFFKFNNIDKLKNLVPFSLFSWMQ